VALDPWQLLGLGRDASPEQVRSAYRRLAAIYHPDRFVDARPDVALEAKLRMQALNEAYRSILQGTASTAPQGKSANSPNRPPPPGNDSGSPRNEPPSRPPPPAPPPMRLPSVLVCKEVEVARWWIPATLRASDSLGSLGSILKSQFPHQKPISVEPLSGWVQVWARTNLIVGWLPLEARLHPDDGGSWLILRAWPAWKTERWLPNVRDAVSQRLGPAS
jgi:hypothetical protein